MDLTLCHSVLLISEIQNNSLCSCQGVNVWCWESVLTLVSRGVKSILPALNHSSRKMTIAAQWNVCKCTHKSVARFPPCMPTRSASVVARLTRGCFHLLLGAGKEQISDLSFILQGLRHQPASSLVRGLCGLIPHLSLPSSPGISPAVNSLTKS